MTEIPIFLFVLLLLIVYPLINLVSLSFAAAAASLAVRQAAAGAAEQSSYAGALAEMCDELQTFYGSRLATFAHLQPADGYESSGAHLYVIRTDYRKDGTSIFGPDTPVPDAFDPTEFVYEMSVEVTVLVSPVVPLTEVPFASQVPGLGKPVKLTFTASRMAKNPMGICMIQTPNTPGLVTSGAPHLPFEMARLQTIPEKGLGMSGRPI